MTFSINTNTGQAVALQTFNATHKELLETQKIISSGLAISSAKDNGAIYAIAQDIRADIQSLNTLDQARDRSLSILDTTIAGSEAVSDILIEMKELALAASDISLTSSQRQAYANEFEKLKQYIDDIVGMASFDGINLLDSNESNFLNIGTRHLPSGLAPVHMGPDSRTIGEPIPGETIELNLAFKGSGLQSERIEGDVTYRMRYMVGNTWTDLELGAGGTPLVSSIPTSPETIIGPGPLDPAYVASASGVVPDIPLNARAVEIYAEYQGVYPWPDGDDIENVTANGAPSSDNSQEGSAILLAHWGEKDWTSTQIGRVNGFGALSLSASTSNFPTEKNGVISSNITIPDDYPGVTEAGFDYIVHYDVLDESTGNWTSIANTGSLNSPRSVVTGDIDLPFSLTVPEPAAANRDFEHARLRLDLTTEHNGEASTHPGTVTSATASLTSSNISFNTHNTSFINTLGSTGSRFKADLNISPIGTAGTPFEAETEHVMRWFDGTNWNEQILDSYSSTGLVGDSVSHALNRDLPAIPGSIFEVAVIARTNVTIDPGGAGETTDSVQSVMMNWDGTNFTTHASSKTLASVSNSMVVEDDVDVSWETVTKVEVLDSITGGSIPIREKNTRTSGLAGLSLKDATLNNFTDAAQTLKLVDAAQARVIRQSQYYATRHNAISISNTMEMKIQDQLTTNLGNLVDADLGKLAHRFEALQIKEKLAVQSLSIANAQPTFLLSLFKR
ncbi:hypothetical protein [Hirschia litorea]|uniref:Flagellin N-terminal domain-containing protein n=1 Tax=Hirschia litorea TaxID=1199156 RepID=A0ABW2IPT7_9PROT